MARNKKKKTTLDDLASMTQKGFLDLGNRLDNRIDGLEKRMERIEKKITNLEEGQEEIKLRLDNVAYRFEIVELQKRVDVLERMVLPKSKK